LWGKTLREIIYLSLHCHRHQNDSCIKVGSDESHFNDSLVVEDKVTRLSVHKPQPFRRERRAEAELSRGLTARPNRLTVPRLRVQQG